MEDRAKELAMAVNTILRDGNEFISIDRDTAKEIADLLDPPEYPCNGELVEVIDYDGNIYIGYAEETGISGCKNTGTHVTMNWKSIKSYRIILEAREFVPHTSKWGADTDFIYVNVHEYTDNVIDNGEWQMEKLTRAEAEEIHRELK